MGSGIKGNWSVTQRDDGTGGNLEVANTLTADTLIISKSVTLPGVIIDEHSHSADAIVSGTIDAARLPKGDGNDDFGVIKIGTAGGLDLSDGILTIDAAALSTLLQLGTAAGADTGTASGNVPILDGSGRLPISVFDGLGDVYAKLTDLDGYAVTGHQHLTAPDTAVPASGIITLEPNKTHYTKTITGNTVIGFDAENLNTNDIITFELLVKTVSTVYPVLFGPTIAWLDGDEPLFNLPNTTYLIAFRSYDGGETWIGVYQGCY